jgi:gluconate 2-dehydrogenase gamma chain
MRKEAAMSEFDSTRRELLLGLAALAGLQALPGCKRDGAARRAPRPWLDSLPRDREPTLAAAVERILPGAAAAGALDFIDYWVRRPPLEFMQHELDIAALHLDRTARQRFSKPFVAATAGEQDEVLASLRQGSLQSKHFDGQSCYRRLVVLTLESFLGDPKYGGNRDQEGWRFIGHHACWWSPRAVSARELCGQSCLPY